MKVFDRHFYVKFIHMDTQDDGHTKQREVTFFANGKTYLYRWKSTRHRGSSQVFEIVEDLDGEIKLEVYNGLDTSKSTPDGRYLEEIGRRFSL